MNTEAIIALLDAGTEAIGKPARAFADGEGNVYFERYTISNTELEGAMMNVDGYDRAEKEQAFKVEVKRPLRNDDVMEEVGVFTDIQEAVMAVLMGYAGRLIRGVVTQVGSSIIEKQMAAEARERF